MNPTTGIDSGRDTNATVLLSFLAVMAALMTYLALLDASYIAAGAVFEYPLDDPYIHMAMAEQMRAGGYGVNPGEYAAASSSPLYSVLLLPFAGDPMQRYMPLFWNCFGLIVAAFLWGRILVQAGFGASVFGAALALIGPVALNMMGLAFTGMEHILHVAASLAIVSGLLTFLDAGPDAGRIGKLLILGILLAPLLRLEGLALAILAALVVLFRGRVLGGVLLLVLAVAPVAGFCYFLTTLGLDPLPSSVTAKLTNPEADGSLTGMIGARMQIILETRAQQVLAAFIAVGAVLLFVKPVWTSTRWPLLFAVGGAGVAHFLFGRFDWMDRYENYILVTMAAGLLAVAAGTKLRGLPLLVLAPILFAGYSYVPGVMEQYPPAGRAVRLQQAQMARLVQEHLKEPVAVNDLGWVAWRNPNYVLDLWGLANHEARALRLTDPHPGWADELVKAQGVNFAMLYGFWFDDAIGDEWVLLGQLKTTGPVDYLGSNFVDVYLTGPVDPAPYLTALADWKAGLPKGALFDFAEGFAQ